MFYLKKEVIVINPAKIQVINLQVKLSLEFGKF
jgi:hypothetical protein